MKDMKYKLMNEYFASNTNQNRPKLLAIKKKLEAYLKKHDDAQVKDVCHLAELFLIENEEENFDTCCQIAQPVLDRLSNLCEWDFYDVRILTVIFNYANTAALSQMLAKKALVTLESYTNEERYGIIKLAIHMNMTARLIRSKYLETDYEKAHEEVTKLGKMFDEHFESAMIVCEEIGSVVHKNALIIRKGIFYADYGLIDKGLDALKEAKEKDVYRIMQSEVNEYNPLTGAAISKRQFNVLVGTSIKKARKAAGVTIDELAFETDVTPTFLNLIERGERGISCHNLYKIAHKLNVKFESFFHMSKSSEEEALNQKLKLLSDKLSVQEMESLAEFVLSLLRNLKQNRPV